MKKTVLNEVHCRFFALSENEGLARVVTAAFLLQYPVSTEELADIKTAVSEAVTNAVVHGYRNQTDGRVSLDLKLYSDGVFRVTVSDRGVGIEDVERAREPFFTTDREHERSGMGFSIMETFMTRVKVTSRPLRGTRVVMDKKLSLWNA